MKTKMNKKSLISAAFAAMLLIGASATTLSYAKSGGECTGPMENSECKCSNTNACSDTSGCNSSSSLEDVIKTIIDILF